MSDEKIDLGWIGKTLQQIQADQRKDRIERSLLDARLARLEAKQMRHP